MSLIADAFNHILAMDVNQDRLVVAAVHKEKKSITSSEVYDLDAFDRESMQKFLSEPIFKVEFDGYCLTVGGFRNTVVPVDIFNHSKAKEIFELNFPSPHEDVDYTRIAELGLVNVHEMPIWIKSAFIFKLPRTKIVHRSTAFLKGVFNGDTFFPQIHINLSGDKFDMVYADKRKLRFINAFNFGALSDVVYHTMHFIEQQNIEQKNLSIHLYGVKPDWESLSEFESYFSAKIKLGKSIEDSEHFILKSQLLCV